MFSKQLDVLIIGGGPAGTTMAAILAKNGRSVAVFEKDKHPRFHIGESLLPMNLPILERLGVLEEVAQIGVLKPGAEFIDGDDISRAQIYNFREAAGDSPPYAYQIRRDEFDHLLWRNCKKCGAQAYDNWRIKKADKTEAGWRVEAIDQEGQKHSIHCQYLIDTSGRHTVLARQFSLKQKSSAHATAALFGHYANVERGLGEREGNISIYWFKQGWFWMIPLRNGLMSVGAVCHPTYLSQRQCSPADYLQQTIDLAPAVKERMKNASLASEVRATGNYSYSSSRCYKDRCMLVGDALAFVDPVFSSGVFLAMSSAEMAAEVIDKAIDKPETFIPACKRYEKDVRAAIRCFSWFIMRFNTPALKRLFLTPKPPPQMRANITSLLAGDVYGETPVYRSIRAFKCLYYGFSLLAMLGSIKMYWQRKINVSTRFVGETTLEENN